MDQHVSINRAYWNTVADDWVARGAHLWSLDRPEWGIWSNPDLVLLPESMAGLDAIELGCGTGYVSGWMDRRGARVTGLDISARQLDTARRLAAEHKADVTFVEGNAEATGLPDAAFDFAVSEYGAAIWCDPVVWLREAARLLRPGGACVFLGAHPLTIVATPPSGAACDRRLHRAYRDIDKVDWTEVEIDPGGIEFNLPMADWMALFTKVGFAVDSYQEVYAPDTAQGTSFSVTADWARAFPCEQVWSLRKT